MSQGLETGYEFDATICGEGIQAEEGLRVEGTRLRSDLGMPAKIEAASSSMSAGDLSKIFLKKTRKWADGRAAGPVDLPEGSGTRAGFSQSVHGKKVAAIKAYWQQMVFSGRATPPPERASVQEIVAYVQTNPGAVGYVPPDTSVGTCKVLQVR